MNRRSFLLGTALLAAACKKTGGDGAALGELHLDWAYYSPLSMVLRRKKWVEEEFAKDGTKVDWILSLGSNKAIELVASGGSHFGSTAGAAALLSRSNGTPLKTVFVTGKPEWTALVVAKDSPVKSIQELRGKKVAATKGTDPFIFFLRALHAAGMKKEDVELVNLQHPDGRTALERGDVAAWAGLDPHMAASELEAGSRLIVRKPEFNSYSVLNVREDFLHQHPNEVRRVLQQYSRARTWALANREELATIVAEEAKIAPAVARKVLLERYEFGTGTPGDEHRAALGGAARVLDDEGISKTPGAAQAALKDLFEPAIAKEIGA